MAEAVKKVKPKFEIPDLSQATPTFLVDELGEVRELIKEWEKYEGVLKQRLSVEFGEKMTLEGEVFAVDKTNQSRVGLKSELVQAKFSAEQLEGCWTQTDYVQLKTRRK